MILDKRLELKPIQYQWAYDYWYKTQNSHWMFTEINMQSDIKDWSEMSEKEKNVIGNILKGFAQTETEVSNYWSELVPKWFPVPEIANMARAFGSWETIHAYAYDYLNETLGLTDYKGFLKDKAISERLESLIEANSFGRIDYQEGDVLAREIAKSIAIFSVACEGIQLFSSFSILLSFRLSNRMKGTGQQMFWSIRDESTHSEAGCKLFNTLCDEYDDFVLTNELYDVEEAYVPLRKQCEEEIREAIDLALEQEFAYIDKIFELGDLVQISASQVKEFMFDRANRKLKEIGYEPTYSVNKEVLKTMDWFYLMISSEQQTDFFDNRETNYSKGNPEWNNDNLFDE